MLAVKNATPSWPRVARIAVVMLLAVAAGGGCTRLVYNRLDTLAGWYLKDLVSLDERQRSDLQTWLEQTLEWHRESELTRYAQFLRDLATTVAKPNNRAVYERSGEQVEAFGDDLMARATPDAARLLLGLSPAQVAELMKNLQEKSQERSAKDRAAIDNGSWRDKRVKETQRQLKRWTGAVTAEQKLMVQQATQRFEPTSGDWLASQDQWRMSMRQALAERESPQQSETRILQLLREPDTEWTPEYKEKSASNREEFLALMETLDASLTRPQREHLQGELIELAEQLEALTDS